MIIFALVKLIEMKILNACAKIFEKWMKEHAIVDILLNIKTNFVYSVNRQKYNLNIKYT